MAVPDWPTTYGHNMFAVPFAKWIGHDHWPIFLEHFHRLMGTVIGVIAIAVLATVCMTQSSRRWLCGLSMLALVMVIIQGIMGGLRVTEISYQLAIVHGIHAQLFFCVTVLLAAATSPVWLDMADRTSDRTLQSPVGNTLRKLSLVLLAVMLLQLTLGAIVRHTQSGLAIYDFPTSYGSILPPMTAQGVKEAQEHLPFDHHKFSTYSFGQVQIAFAHRVGAVLVLIVAGVLLAQLARGVPDRNEDPPADGGHA